MMHRVTSLPTASVAACAILLGGVLLGTEKYDLSKFDAGELTIVKWALGRLEANENCYAYLTVNHQGQDVLRMSNKPLARPNGQHPEARPPAADLFLLVGGLKKSPAVMTFLKARVAEHNRQVRDNLKENAERVATADPSLRRETQSPTLRRPEATLTDLDRILRLISQGGSINSEVLPVSSADLDERSAVAWVRQVEQLQSAPGAPGEAAKMLRPAVEDIRAAAEGYEKARQEARAASSKVRPRTEAAEELRNDPLYGASTSELQSMIDRGGQSAIRAQEYMNRLENSQFESFLSFAERVAAGYPHLLAALDRLHDYHARADVRRHGVVVKTLLADLRGRAGAETEKPDLDVKYCVMPRGSARFPSELLFYLVVHSRSSKELTQLTLLVKIETSEGTRYATYYIPSLPPGASGRFEPVTLSPAALQDALGTKPGKPELKQVRYAVWCQQFAATGQELTPLNAEEFVTDVWLQAAQPGISYVSLGNPSLKEEKRRYELIFRRVAPSKVSFAVEFDVIDHENKDKSTRYRGTMTLPPVKLGDNGQVLHAYETSKFGYMQKAEEKAMLVKAEAGSEKLELTLWGRWNDLPRKWQAKFSTAGFREFVPSGQVPTADSPEEKSRRAAEAAMKLAQAGKFDEAKSALEQVIRDYPGTPGESSAKFMLTKLDQMKAGQAKARELEAQRKKFLEDKGLTPRDSRPPLPKKK